MPFVEGAEITEDRLNEFIVSVVEECTCLRPPSSLGVDIPMRWNESDDSAVVRLRPNGGSANGLLDDGVIGSGDPEKSHDSLAEKVGKLLAGRGAVLVCGGLSGIMEAASRGSERAGGMTIGILPGTDKRDANPHIVLPLPTGMGVARNVLVVQASDAIIALPGGPGTMSEIALALNIGKPVIDLGNWNIAGTLKTASADEAVTAAMERASESTREAASGPGTRRLQA